MTEPGAAAWPEGTDVVRDLVVVQGPDAVGWLQGQMSQDVAAMGVGESRRTLVLDPRGRVDALVQLLLRAPEEVDCIVASGFGEALAARLRRFRLRVRADLVLVEGVPGRFEPLAGAGAPTPGPAAPGPPVADELVVHEDWPGMEGSWRLWPGQASSQGVPVPEHAAALLERRLRAGLPELGADVEVGMQPHETSLVPWTVSFDKGCYVGQELVARVDARSAAPPRRLVRARLEAEATLAAAGTEEEPDRGAVAKDWAPRAQLLLPSGAGEAGRLTSSVRGSLALALVMRRVDVPGTVETVHGRLVRLEPLPEPSRRR